MNIQTFPFLLDGEWRVSESSRYIDIRCPYKPLVVGRVPSMTTEEAASAVLAAERAQKQWATMPMHKRAGLLHAWADEMLRVSGEIAEFIMLEVGKSGSAALAEVERSADLIRHTAEEGRRIGGELISGDAYPGVKPGKTARVDKVPLGVVLAISPFNYPVNLSVSKIAPALIAGNTVVLKPPTQGAISALLAASALQRAGCPPGVLNVVTGRGAEIGDALTSHKSVNCISFTGGTATGREICRKANMIPVILELGGKDPAIVLEDADLDLAAREIVSGAFAYSGQRCTAIKRVLVSEPAADQLVELLRYRIEQLRVGSPEEQADITPLIDTQAADKVSALISEALDEGALLVNGNRREGNLVYPTLLDGVTERMRIAWEEPFGPVLPVIRVRDAEEAVRWANDSEYGLQASVFTRDMQAALSIAGKLDVGSVQLNGKTERGPDHFPFLGVKSSGLGVQGIRKSIETMVRDKVTVFHE
ncbi:MULTISPECIES: NADP-dependent glyceraldehyde-3-phosphate dehydrogenase [unclassified Paenibacillus]|uniref:NADP-dependent glyceraldehyde-3-phosphate dehydrogenase n=1 Tax=unclassified Paenibacillus TaxID=185978 RepID=UPI0009313EF4|nr:MULTISPECIES: NADP-dependent glyceraldehyde-3-phosphate dehydrogenase [unclassified Paenibacillus]